MNRSYSKLRHIQESNMRLERRLINEQVTGATSTAPVAAVETVANILLRYQNSVRPKFVKINPNNTRGIVWKETIPGQPSQFYTYFKNCDTGVLTRDKDPERIEKSKWSVISLDLCRSLIPDSQVVKNQEAYSAKQAQYIKDNPSQTGAPTHYRGDGSTTMDN